MPSLLMPDEAELAEVTDDVFSYMCSLAMEKCSKKSEKKKASCGGEAMRRRLLIKNFVAQMIAHERQSRVDGSPPPALGEEDTGEEDSGLDMDLDDGRLSMVVSERPHERATTCSFDGEGEEEREEDGEDEDSSSDDGEEEESEVDDEKTEEGENQEEEGNGDDTTASDCSLQSPSLAHYPPFGTESFYPPPFTAQQSTTTIAQDYGCFSSTETSWANLQAHLHQQGCYNDASCSRYDGSSHFHSDSPSSHISFFYPIPSSTAGTAINPAPTDPASSTVVVVAEEVREELRLGEMSLLEDEKLTCTSQFITQSGGNYTTTATTTTSVRAFTSLSNVAFSAAAKLGSCRSEFMPSAYHHLHHQSKSITDLDTHITVLEEEEDVEETGNKCLDTSTDSSGSPRKRHLPLLVVGDGVGGGALYSTSSYCVSKLAKRFKL